MTDVQVHQVRNLMDERDVAVIDPVAGVHLQIEVVCAHRRLAQPFQFLFHDLVGISVGQFARVQFDHVRAERDRPIDLFSNRIDEQTHADAGGVKPFHRRRQLFPMGHDIEPAFRRDFLPLLGNEQTSSAQSACAIADLRVLPKRI